MVVRDNFRLASHYVICPKRIPDSDGDVSSLSGFPVLLQLRGVMDINTESFRTLRQIAAISSNKSWVALSESCGTTYVPSATGLRQGHPGFI